MRHAEAGEQADEEGEHKGLPLSIQVAATNTASPIEDMAYLPKVMSLPFWSSRLRINAGLGTGSRPSLRRGWRGAAISLRIWASHWRPKSRQRDVPL